MDWELAKILTMVYLPPIIIFLIITLGLVGTPQDFEVNPEYINGILTASSILFGFWAVIFRRPSKDIVKRHIYKAYGKLILINIAILVISTLCIFYSAMDKLSSIDALFAVTLSFCSNAWLLGIGLYSHFKHLTEVER